MEFIQNPEYRTAFAIIGGMIVSGIIAAVSYKARALSVSGSAAMVITGTIVFGLGGIAFAVPLIFFFVSSSALSAINPTRKETAKKKFDKTGPRDQIQVFANGGVGAICAILYFATDNPACYIIYVASICEAAADTWATEIGTLSKTKPVSIMGFRKTEPGSSGGISIAGTMAALAGAAATSMASYYAIIIYDNNHNSNLYPFIITAAAGFLGSMADSVLGAAIQGRYKCASCFQITERKLHCSMESELVKGFSWVNNDLVNLFSTLISAAAAALILFI